MEQAELATSTGGIYPLKTFIRDLHFFLSLFPEHRECEEMLIWAEKKHKAFMSGKVE